MLLIVKCAIFLMRWKLKNKVNLQVFVLSPHPLRRTNYVADFL